MTAFEILLNRFYDSIENNEPINKDNQNSSELYPTIKQFIETSFYHGHNLSYSNLISDCLEKSEILLKQASHEQWAYVKYIFVQNELNIIRNDRVHEDVQNLKMSLDNTLFV